MAGSAWRGRPGLILGALTALNGLNYLDRYVAAATLTLILADLRLSDSQGGLLQSMFIVTYALACPLAGWLGDRGSRMRLAAVGIFIWSLATVGSGLATSYALLLLARAVTGIGEAGYGVVTPPLLSDCYPPARRAAMLGIFYAAIPVGSALGFTSWAAWWARRTGGEAAFFVAGAPGVALAFVLLLLAEPLAGASTPLPRPGPRRRSPRAPSSDGRAMCVNTAAQIIYTFAMGGLATWAPAYFVRERGIPLAVATTTFGGLLVVAGFLGTLIGGRLAQRLARRSPGADFVLSGWSLTASIVFTLFAILSPQPLVFWPAMFVMLLPAVHQYRAAQCGDGERAAGRPPRAGLCPHHHAHASPRRRGVAVADRPGLGLRRAQAPGTGHRLPALPVGSRAPHRAPHAGAGPPRNGRHAGRRAGRHH